MAQGSTAGKYTIYAVSWDGRLHQINVADGAGCRAAREVPAAQRQAVRPERRQRRHLHGHRAGLRRRAERVLFVSTWRRARRACSCRPAAACGAGGARRFRLKASSTWSPATRTFSPATRSLGNAIVGAKLDAEPAAAARRLLRAAERQLDVAARSRHERHADGVRLPRTEVPRRHEQGMPGVAARSRRARRRGSPHDAPHHAAAVQRRSGVRRQGRVGRDGRLAGCARRAVGARAVLGTGQPHLPRADRVRPADAWAASRPTSSKETAPASGG